MQQLPWREKLLHASHLCRALSPLEPADFRCDQLVLDGDESSVHWPNNGYARQPHNWTNQSTFCTSPSLQRLFTQVHHLAITAWEQRRRDSYLAVLCPPSPTAPSAFSGVRVLELILDGEASSSLIERLFPSSVAFRSLEHLYLDVRPLFCPEETALQREALLPLSRLPRLRCLEGALRLSLDGLFFLCSLPLTRLNLFRYCVEVTDGPKLPLTVTSTWETVALPGTFVPRRATGDAICAEVLMGYAGSIAAAAAAGMTGQSTLQRLIGCWDTGSCSMRAIARIPSLTELLPYPWASRYEDAVPDLSLLFTSDLQPLLPRLHTLRLPYMSHFNLSNETMAALATSSAAFLTAYSAQLQVLALRVYSVDSATMLMESVLRCAQLRSLTICYGVTEVLRVYDLFSRHYVDVEQLDQAVAALPPLRLLTELRLECIYISVQALTQFLSNCPAVRVVTLKSVSMHLPLTIALAGGRTVPVER